jgi:hypothetical protein
MAIFWRPCLAGSKEAPVAGRATAARHRPLACYWGCPRPWRRASRPPAGRDTPVRRHREDIELKGARSTHCRRYSRRQLLSQAAAGSCRSNAEENSHSIRGRRSGWPGCGAGRGGKLRRVTGRAATPVCLGWDAVKQLYVLPTLIRTKPTRVATNWTSEKRQLPNWRSCIRRAFTWRDASGAP